MSYRYLQEYTALGTAGGLYHFRDQILAGNPDSFFVMNSDVCGDFPLKEMLSFTVQKGGGSHCTVLGTEVRGMGSFGGGGDIYMYHKSPCLLQVY